jgi:hypothetical protein
LHSRNYFLHFTLFVVQLANIDFIGFHASGQLKTIGFVFLSVARRYFAKCQMTQPRLKFSNHNSTFKALCF